MSTQNKLDLLLIGNLVVDEIYRIDGWPLPNTSNAFSTHKRSLGGIGNLLEALRGSGFKIGVEASRGDDLDGYWASNKLADMYAKGCLEDWNLTPFDEPTSQAVVLSDAKGGVRTSFVRWGCGKRAIPVNPRPAKWAHVSYLDMMPQISLDALRKEVDILSADLCLSSQPCREAINANLKLMDYLFLSDAEIGGLVGEGIPASQAVAEVAKPNPSLRVLCHSLEGTFMAAGNDVEFVPSGVERIENIDVLGAGDAYCANFIRHMLSEGTKDYPGAIKNAHAKATEFLMKRNDK